MSLLEAIILGLVQGLTEFLPVSSSGHLVIFQKILGLNEPGITLEVLLHFATLLAVLVVFRRDFTDLLNFTRDKKSGRYLLMLLIGVASTGIIYLIFNRFVAALFQSTLLVGLMLMVTGLLLQLTRFTPGGKKDKERIKVKDAALVGVLQAIAIIPGISRSGTTILGALWRGLNRETAVKFSFMLAAPVILGATLLEVKELIATGLEKAMLINYLAGGLFAFLAGIFAIKVFIRLLKGHKLHYFSYYCLAAGLFVTVFALLGLV